MKLHKTRRMVRVLSMVLVVAMLLSAMMVQAFGAVSDSKSLQGYTATARVGQYSNHNAFGEVTFDVSAGLTITLSGHYINSYGRTVALSGSGGGNHYQAVANANAAPTGYTSCYVDADAYVGYNGETVYLNPFATLG